MIYGLYTKYPFTCYVYMLDSVFHHYHNISYNFTHEYHRPDTEFDTNNVSNLHSDHRHGAISQNPIKIFMRFTWNVQMVVEVHMGFSCIYKVILYMDFKYTFEILYIAWLSTFGCSCKFYTERTLHLHYWLTGRVNIYLLLYVAERISNNNPLESFKLNM